MTAQIGILNKSGIALATDSAVTIQSDKGLKAYDTVNKLFTLSKFEPVAIMIYGNAEFSGIPWETIIKEFREKLWDQKYQTLEEYAKEFIDFVRSGYIVNDDERLNYFRAMLASKLVQIRKSMNKEVKQVIEYGSEISETKILEILADKVSSEARKISSYPYIKSATPKVRESLKPDILNLLGQLLNEIFEKIPINASLRTVFENFSFAFLFRSRFTSHFSGIVIAGFGSNQKFPSLRSYKIDFGLNGYLKYESENPIDIGVENTATIVPFAQSEMVHEFMTGIHPQMSEFLESFTKEILAELPSRFVASIAGIRKEAIEPIKEGLVDTCKKLSDQFWEKLREYQTTLHSNPIVNTVAILPKDEIAIMAEALVNITSFKRRMSLDVETVGGEIDVAVISRGDGFVWIKRKHYFDKERNPHFGNNYYSRHTYENKKD